jgi:hypothetical protein
MLCLFDWSVPAAAADRSGSAAEHPSSVTAAKPLSYFTTTLGEAAVWNETHPHEIKTINGLLDRLGCEEAETRDRLAVGFPIADGSVTTFTFGELNALAAAGANSIAEKLSNIRTGRSATEWDGQITIGLLARSSPEFLFAWLGAMRLGHAVLLLA